MPTTARPRRGVPHLAAPISLALALALGSCASAPPGADPPSADPPSAALPRAAPPATGAAAAPDDLAARLRLYLALLEPGAPPAPFVAFLAANPVWPDRAALLARYGAALLRDGDDGEVASLCRRLRPPGPAALDRCAELTGDGASARAAWRLGVDAAPGSRAAAAAFRARWQSALSRADDQARFDALARSLPSGGPADAAADTAALLDPPHAALARARLLLLGGGPVPDPLAVRDAVPAPERDDPRLVLDVARALRRNDDGPGAARFWSTEAGAVEAAAPPALQLPYWGERDRLARTLLERGDSAGALSLADDPNPLPDSARAEQLFLEGWIRLRFRHDPDGAERCFTALDGAGTSLITRARAEWWLAAVAEARGDAPLARRRLLEAARFPTSFYGQLALGRLAPGDDRLRAALAAAGPAPPTADAALRFAAEPWPRAAILLTAWGDARRAPAFLDFADRLRPDPSTHLLAARLARSLGFAPEAVAISRRAGRDGLALPQLGWPAPFLPEAAGDVSAPLVLGLVRQESSFDPLSRSPSGALGLMQLLPPTAAAVGRTLGLGPVAPSALTADPALNLRLGTAYLAYLLGRAGGNVPLAVASYNAGPHRAASWPPPPSAPLADPLTIDWIEAIPISETRNYVERVLENEAVYRAEGASS